MEVCSCYVVLGMYAGSGYIQHRDVSYFLYANYLLAALCQLVLLFLILFLLRMLSNTTRTQLEYDLDIYNVVAVDDFNMGAMENKSLNVFNTAYVLADEKTATDGDFQRVEAVIGHEYFHNWTGNRVTCRDWFQLTLKEGLTVFRDQEFSADMGSAAVKRVEDVRGLRARQFSEDAGPMSHPIRPESYISSEFVDQNGRY